MNVLVLGGCGFIGSHVAEQLLEEEHDVRIFARSNADRRNLRAVGNRVTFVSGDFLNAEDVARAVCGVDVVIHLVGTTLPGNSLDSPVFDIQTNVIASVNLFASCVEAGVKRIVYVSSGGTIYGIPRTILIREDHPQNPINPYGLSKLSIEKFLGIYHHHYGIEHTILRLSNPYGERQRPGSGQGVIATWLDRVRKGLPIELWGEGSTVRDYLPVEDAASAVVLAVSSNSAQRIFNVGSGLGHSLEEVLRTIEEVSSRQATVLRKETRRVDVPRNVLDVSLISNELKWRSTTSLQDGIRAMWEAVSRRR